MDEEALIPFIIMKAVEHASTAFFTCQDRGILLGKVVYIEKREVRYRWNLSMF